MEKITGHVVVLITYEPNGNSNLILITVPPPSFVDIVACHEAQTVLEKVRREQLQKSN